MGTFTSCAEMLAAWTCGCSTTGRPTPAQLARCREAFPNATFHSAYGMTEVGSTITWRTLWGPNQEPVELHALEEGAHPSALSCVGRPIHSTQVPFPHLLRTPSLNHRPWQVRYYGPGTSPSHLPMLTPTG